VHRRLGAFLIPLRQQGDDLESLIVGVSRQALADCTPQI
jgi:hypothetical protein